MAVADVKCSCGASMVFDPDKRALVCAYCGNEVTIDRTVAVKRDFIGERSFGEVPDGETLFTCPNCGAEVELENYETATECPFCGGNNIVKKESLEGLRPDSILPFAIGRDRALAMGKKWLKRKIFAPYKLKKSFSADKIKGVYIPSFTFDALAESSYEGRLGHTRTRMVGSGKNRRMETYIDWFYVSGTDTRPFSDIVTEASVNLEQWEIDKLCPFDTEQTEGYRREYLAGFSAERYSSSLDESFAVADGKMNDVIRRAIIASYSADHVDRLDVRTEYSMIKFRYILLPIWIVAYKYREKLYRFLINARTGSTAGKTPLSPIRVSAAVLLGAGIVGALVWFFFFSGII